MSDAKDDRLLPAVYRDLASGATREVGEVLQRSVRLALAPVRAALWSIEQIEAFLATEIPQRLAERQVEPEAVHPPPGNVASGVVLGLLVAGGEESIRAMYAELLATAMSTGPAEDTEDSEVHPAYPEVIRQLSAADASRLQHFYRLTKAGTKYPPPILTRPARLQLANLLRLGLLELEAREPSSSPFWYDKGRESLSPTSPYRSVTPPPPYVRLSEFGLGFCAAVLPRSVIAEVATSDGESDR